MILFDRAAWGARYGLGPLDPGPEELVVVHHAVSPRLLPGAALEEERRAMRTIERDHVERRGWAGFGYNFAFTPNGHVYEGRGWQRAGAHAGTSPDNFRSIGLVYLADGRIDDLTPAAVEAVRELLLQGVALGELAPLYELKGHRELKATECPGDLVFARLAELRP